MQHVQVEPFQLIGIGIRTTNENSQATQEIAALWQRFLQENILAKVPNKADKQIYSLYTDYQGDYTKPYLAILGCKVKTLHNVPDGMIGKSFTGGNYIKTTATGDLTKGLIVSHWSKIFSMEWNRAYTADFEVFGEKAQNPANAEVDFYVAIQ